jgi:hypothetical protein
MMDESVHPFAWAICLFLFIFLGLYSLALAPFILGIFVQQKHRCPKCLNYIREDSVLNMLDDNILEVQIWSFGLLIKRRSLIIGLTWLVLMIVAYYLFTFAQNGKTWCIENKRADGSWY